jgi:uncharacterized protein (TIGR00255 family)
MSAVRSMTGFGGARRESAGAVAEVEARSVNNRHLVVSLRAPAAYEARHAELETLVRSKLQRGTVNVTIAIRSRREAAPARIDSEVVADYLRQLEDAGLPTSAEVVGQVLRLPGAVEEASAREADEEEIVLVGATVAAALDALVAMREREGEALATELASGIAEVERLADAVARRSPQAVAAAHERLKERIALLVADVSVPPELLAREVAVLADRTDVAEEVARLCSHVAQWREALESGGAIGRRLDFLAQELGREANTIGSKSQDAEIARAVIDMKVAIERLKEQGANVE